jgi:predicted deacylase
MTLAIAAMVAGCSDRPPGEPTQRPTESPSATPAPGTEPAPIAPPPAPIGVEDEDSLPVPSAVAEAQPPDFAAVPPPTADPPSADGAETAAEFVLLGQSMRPGTAHRLMWSASKIFEGMSSETPVLVVHGRSTGPVLCLTAAVHGDELNGIEMVRRVLHDLSPEALKGTVIGIPIVNIHGFRRGSRYLPDRRDLNRFFPGTPGGSSAARIAHSLFENIVRRCTALVDLHTGSFYRSNLPQVRADLTQPAVRVLAHGFGGMLVLNSEAAPGTLRRAATDAGIPAVILEAGEPLRMQPKQVEQGVAGLNRLLGSLGMKGKFQLLAQPEPVYFFSRWVRSDHGGVLFSVVRLGQQIRSGDILGTVTDPITNEQNLIYAPVDGRVIGMAVNQVVMPGFAAFHLGMETDAAAAAEGPQAHPPESDDEIKRRNLEIAEANGAEAED